MRRGSSDKPSGVAFRSVTRTARSSLLGTLEALLLTPYSSTVVARAGYRPHQRAASLESSLLLSPRGQSPLKIFWHALQVEEVGPTVEPS